MHEGEQARSFCSRRNQGKFPHYSYVLIATFEAEGVCGVVLQDFIVHEELDHIFYFISKYAPRETML